jgi:transposase
MNGHDTRTLSPAAQEEIRFRVVAALQAGMGKSKAARTFGVSRTSINSWLAKVVSGNATALKSRKRGRKPGSRLKGHEAARVVRTITDRCPDQLKMPFALWTREAVQRLLAERFSLSVSVWTVGRYLKRWNLTPQKPLRRAYEQNPEKVKRWLEEEYPRIRWACAATIRRARPTAGAGAHR